MKSNALREDNNIEIKICDLLGINKEQGLPGTMRLEIEHDLIKVMWDGVVYLTEDKDIQAVVKLINENAYVRTRE